MSLDTVIADTTSVIGAVAAVTTIYGFVQGFRNKGKPDKQIQIASASHSRPLLSVVAVLFIAVAYVVLVLHLAGILMGGWPNPLGIVMIIAGVVLVILQLVLPLSSYKRWFDDFNNKLASSDTGAIVIRGHEKWLDKPVYIEKKEDEWLQSWRKNPPVYFVDEGAPTPFYVAVFDKLMPENYLIIMPEPGKPSWKRSSEVRVQPGKAREVDFRAVKSSTLTE